MTDKKKIIEIEEQGKYFKFSNKIYEVYHISENLNDGYKEFKSKIDEKINYFEKNNIKTNIKNTVNFSNKISFLDLLKQNMVRSIFALLTSLIIILIIIGFTSTLLKKNEIKGGRQFWKNFENELEKLSNKKIYSDTQDKILNSIRKIGENYKPFLDEIKKITD